MGTDNFDYYNIVTWWKCVPEPEQRLLIALAELAQTPAQTVSFTDCVTIMTLAGALPAEERTKILLAYDGITTITDSNPLCGDPDGCVFFPTSYYLGQIWACRLTGGCQVGAPKAPPCYYALTAPAP